MDLFSRFPESNTQGRFLPKINEDNIDTNDTDINEAEKENNKSNFKFDNLQKVIILRKRFTILFFILLLLLFLFTFIINNFLINLSLRLITNYAIREKFMKKTFNIITEISINISYIFAIILYLKYPLTYSFSYILSLILAEYFYALIFIIFGIDREKDINLRKFYLNGSEKPNLILVKIIIIFFGFWRLLKSKGRNKKEINKYKKINNILFILSILITTIEFLEQIFVQECSIKSCLNGLIGGILIYTILYERMCIQYMKGNYFITYISKNFFILTFLILIFFFIIVFMFNNYNEISDIFEIMEYIPYKGINVINHIAQYNMNRISLIKSLKVFLLIFMIYGIKYNYKFVNSRKNKNYFNLDDIVLFNKDVKIFITIKNNFLVILIAIFLIIFEKYLNFYYKIQIIHFLLIDIIIYFTIGFGLFGYGIKQMMKPNFEEGRELDNYEEMEFSGKITPEINNDDINDLNRF